MTLYSVVCGAEKTHQSWWGRPWLHPYHIGSFAGWLFSWARRPFNSEFLDIHISLLHADWLVLVQGLAADGLVLGWLLMAWSCGSSFFFNWLMLNLIIIFRVTVSWTLNFQKCETSSSESSPSTSSSKTSLSSKKFPGPSGQSIFWPS